MLSCGLRELKTIHSPPPTSTCIVEYCSRAHSIGIMLSYGLRELQTIHSPSATSTCIVEYCSRAHSIGIILSYGLCELKTQFAPLPPTSTSNFWKHKGGSDSQTWPIDALVSAAMKS